ncbi:MFS transporter [Amycolatopsis sp. NPDC026612]|uniref:MFS transporter n=1 Tax=Amycolatopsis sp. NPDC026612 TaxID=3155466 RepID=UPI0033D3E86C
MSLNDDLATEETPAGPIRPVPAAGPAERVSTGFILWMALANFGVSMAYIVPLSFSLALRIQQLVPGHEEVLGYATGIAQAVFIVTAPLVGIWSDRTRSRLGRRRPFMVGGIALGMAGLVVIALAPNVPVLMVGWVVAMFGWSNTGSAIVFLQADLVPEEQRGRISGLTGLSAQVAPVLGIGIVSAFIKTSTFLVFFVPGAVGVTLTLLFVFLGKDPDSRLLALPADRISLKKVFASYAFNPRKYPDFGWNWFGRFAFFMGLYLNTTFGTFFYAQRLEVSVAEVGAIVAIVGLLGVVAAAAGALGGGWLSDKLQRRKLFVLVGAVLFAGGALIEANAYSLPVLVVGSVVMNLSLAAFGAVDGAIVMAILPDRAEAGRYMSVVQFAQKLPSAIAPLIAPLVITIGAVGSLKNYTLLYLVGGVFALLGGLIILLKVKSVR